MLPVEARLQLSRTVPSRVHFVAPPGTALPQLGHRPRRTAARKIINLCWALQNHLAIGYKLIVVERRATSRDRAQLLAVGIQRAIRSLCGPLIRASRSSAARS
ncbi:hypothetical protein ACHWUR_29270, partial [Klebsiella pneumoniae]